MQFHLTEARSPFGMIGDAHLGPGNAKMNLLEGTIEALRITDLRFMDGVPLHRLAASVGSVVQDQFVFNTAGKIIEL